MRPPLRASGDLNWPAGLVEQQEIDQLATALAPKYGSWLAEVPALEDVTQLTQDIARPWQDAGAIGDYVQALELKQSTWAAAASSFREFLGGAHRTLSGELHRMIDKQRLVLWRHRVQEINWELIDHGTKAFTWYAMEELIQGAKRADLLAAADRGGESQRLADQAVRAQLGKADDLTAFEPFRELCSHWDQPFREHVFFWPRKTGPKGDLVDDEMSRVLQVPGWSNIFTQPIINRIEMLSTGVRTDIGVKVFGPDLETIDRVCKDIEVVLKPINGSRDVIAAPIMGKGYLQVDIDREAAARYGDYGRGHSERDRGRPGGPRGDLHRREARSFPGPHPLCAGQPRG